MNFAPSDKKKIKSIGRIQVDSQERYRRLDNGLKPDYALVQLDSISEGKPGKVDLVQPFAINSEKGGPERSVAVIARSERLVGKVDRDATTRKRTSIIRAKCRRRCRLR